MGYASHHAAAHASHSFSLAVRDANSNAQTLYTTQLALNFLWMPLFFRLGRPAVALGDLTLLAGTVGALMVNWWSADRTAFWCLVPYATWLGYAAYLNAGCGILNGWRIPTGEKERSE
jgi:benzodiazapine receptor